MKIKTHKKTQKITLLELRTKIKKKNKHKVTKKIKKNKIIYPIKFFSKIYAKIFELMQIHEIGASVGSIELF